MKSLLSQFVLWYLPTAAKIQLKKYNPTIIGVAGSSGKSSLVRLLQETLQEYRKVLSSGGKNSETGIPLSILGIHMDNYRAFDWIKALIAAKWALLTNWKNYDIYIAEMGIDSPVEPKNMNYLLKIVHPTIGMVTNVSLEHSVYFDEFISENAEHKRKEKILEMTAAQELLLVQSLPQDGTAIINLDDTYIAASRKQIKAHQVTISLKRTSADLSATHIKLALDAFQMDIIYQGSTYTLQIPQLLPEFYAYEFLFVLATLVVLGISLPDAIKSLEKHFSLPGGRFSVLKGIKNTTIIDSSYNNATLEPILGIFSLLKKVARKQRVFAIIGDMRELGSQSKYAHETLAEGLIKSVDEVILIGPLLRTYVVPILKKSKLTFQSFDTFTQAKQAILDSIKERDIVLVKSSQNTLFLERVVEMLLADKKDVAKLCRRGKFWDQERAKAD